MQKNLLLFRIGFCLLLVCETVPSLFAQTPSGSLVVWGINSKGQTNIPSSLSGVTKVCAGPEYFVALKSDGTVVAYGDNTYGQTTIPPAASSGVVDIATGYYNTLALKTNGTVVAWGPTWGGLTNINSVPVGLTNVKSIAVGTLHAVALKSDGTVTAWGDNSRGQTNVPAGLANVTAIACSYSTSYALKSDGTIVTWGYYNKSPAVSGVKAIAASSTSGYTAALKSDGTMVVWSSGSTSFTLSNFTSELQGVSQIAVGSGVMAITTNKTIVALTYTTYYTNNDPTVVPYGVVGVTGLSMGENFNVAIIDGSTNKPVLVPWGNNYYGQSYIPAAVTNNGLRAISLGAGDYYHSSALTTMGQVVVWGGSGIGDGMNKVPAEASNGVSAISCGYSHMLALKRGSVIGWGNNSDGQTSVPAAASNNVVAISAGWVITTMDSHIFQPP